ncbi:sulfurtransferase [Bordetella avium]|uniref:Thiosulfate sulfurtransferase n=1 Tax=Bordetella avium (strain 197N) TaxID=360910 RepID=Q2KZ07_BORA1|nr:sulfurtransferase [Bordetella avium]AZY49491.1 sulfurtransferase [Bordetella avium]AZY52888.1 sulfurtransferase [Bordetella avium]RIQ11732.1 sulfurtransferase [Bordetella avium]RIQ16155.1 sulfurtransferase [Bordetella avium]RIQ30308.1 sulfurtransferase [Bordetella avium]
MTMTLISVADLAARGAAVRIFDLRHDLMDHSAGARAYAQAHIPGARYLNHETELSATRTGKNGRHPLPDRDLFAGLMAAHGVTPETLVVAYDASGGIYAAHLWWMLRWIGHDRVAVLDGGWQAWTAAGLPTQSGAGESVAPLAGVHAGAPQVASVDVQAVLANIPVQAFTVIDARAANRYRGEVEPMDPVAGHIPGALNRPNVENLTQEGRFKSPEQLRAEFTALLDGRAPESIVHQCGSGITASHNLLSMEVAGLSGSRLYPGSWSEWCADPARPVAKG